MLKNKILGAILLLLIIMAPATAYTPKNSISGQKYCDPNENNCEEGYNCSGSKKGLEMTRCCPENTEYDFYNNKCEPKCIDLDEDGYGTNCIFDYDCNDENPEINPGMNEYCDNTDNNCNGETDENCKEKLTNYEQENSTLPTYCSGIEICNGKDDNCNGIIDENCLNLDYITTNTTLSTQNTHLEGKLKWGESDCDWEAECDPGLKCKGEKWYPTNQVDGCCYPGEYWDGTKCYTHAENEGDCDTDENCQQGLHCSTTETGAWTRDLTNDVCCSEGKEYDKKTKKCQPCGVWAEPDDSDYCEKKETIGCGCIETEGDCDSNTECVIGNYCYDNWGIDRCCAKGTIWNGQECEKTHLEITCEECTDCDENKCYSIGQECTWDNKCITKTKLKRNEGSCQELDEYCCDKDNGCNPETDLECMSDAYVGFDNTIEFSVCCYPWERQGRAGRCELDTPTGDRDGNIYWDRVEVLVGANPTIKEDTPWNRLKEDKAGSYFDPPFINDDWGEYFINALKNTITANPIFAAFTTGKNIGAYYYGMVTGVASGAIFGLVDDITFVAMIGKFIVYVPIKILAFFNEQSNGVEALKNAGYEVKSLWTGIKEAFGNGGQILTEIGNEGLDTLEQRAKTLSPFEEEKNQIVMTKSFVKYYVAAFILEQIFLLKGLSSIKAMQVGKFFGYLDKIQEIPVAIAKAAAKLIGKGGMWILKLFRITNLAKWGQEHIVKAIKVMISARNQKYLAKLFIEIEERGAYELTEQISKLIDDVGTDKTTKLIKSNVGMKALETGWSSKSQKILAELIDTKGRGFYNKAFKHFTEEQIEQVGKRLDEIPEKLGKEIMEKPGGAKALLKYTDEAALAAYGKLSGEVGEELADQIIKRADAEEILQGLTKKLEIEETYPFIKKITLPENVDDAAAALKFFNDPNVQRQFRLIEKLDMGSAQARIVFEHLDRPVIASVSPLDVITINLKNIDNPTLSKVALIHEFGHVKLNKILGSFSDSSLTPAKELLNDVLIIKKLDDSAEGLAAAMYSQALRDSIAVRNIDNMISSAKNIDIPSTLTDPLQIINKKKSAYAPLVRTYQEAAYQGMDDITREIEKKIAKEFGEEAATSLRKSKGAFMEVFQKNPDIIDVDDLRKTADAVDSVYDDFVGISDDIAEATTKITAEFGKELGEETIKKLAKINKLFGGTDEAINTLRRFQSKINVEEFVDDIYELQNIKGVENLVKELPNGPGGRAFEARTARILKDSNKEIAELSKKFGTGEIDILLKDGTIIECKQGWGTMTKESPDWQKQTEKWRKQIEKYTIETGTKEKVKFMFDTPISNDVAEFFGKKNIKIESLINGEVISYV